MDQQSDKNQEIGLNQEVDYGSRVYLLFKTSPVL